MRQRVALINGHVVGDAVARVEHDACAGAGPGVSDGSVTGAREGGGAAPEHSPVVRPEA